MFSKTPWQWGVFLILIVGCGWYIFGSVVRLPSSVDDQSSTTVDSSSPESTPFPFQELTIPAMRERTYESQLGALQQRDETATYTSYRTSYTSDGLRVFGLLTIPKETAARPRPEKGWPAIVFVHGYIPPTRYQTEQNYQSYVDAFARQGFVVFKIDLRGHDQSEGEASGAYYSPDYITDTLTAYTALQSHPAVNPAAIGLWGHSMAGNVVLRSVATKPTIPAAVIWGGAVYTYQDLQKYGIEDTSYRPPSTLAQRQRRREVLRSVYGEFEPTHWFWQQVVPVNYLDGVATAMQLHHAVDDAVVSIQYARDLAPLLELSGIEHQLFEYQSGGHNISGASFSQAMQRSVEFFQNQLQE